MNDYNLYSSLVNDLKIMSWDLDFVVVANIVKFNKPNKILELGAGDAAWCIGINKILNNVNIIPDITAVENFHFITAIPGYGLGWSKSKKLLEQKIEHICNRLKCKHNIKVLDVDALLIPKKLEHERFDLIRLDCLDVVKDIESILRWAHSSLTDDGLLYIDDIKPSITIGRFLVAMDLVREKLFKIIWIGDKEAIFCKWNSTKNFVPENVHNNINTIINMKYPKIKLIREWGQIHREWCQFHEDAPGFFKSGYWIFKDI